MSKTIRFKENSLIAIKEKLNEIMVGTGSVSHNNVCEDVGKEFAPVTTIGDGGNNPPLGGNHYGIEEENIDFDNNGMSINDEKILGKYNLKDLILSKTGNYVTLNKIVAKELGKGYGTKFMEELARVADKNGWVLVLTPDTTFGGSSVSRLKNFYKRFGFVPNKGRNTDFNTRESMIRKPINESNENTFEKWFGNSILRDENGNPIKMYHGTDVSFNSFSKEHIGRHGSYEGYGFNFTPCYTRAVSYNSNTVIEAYLRAEHPMTSKTHKLTPAKIAKVIAEIDKGVPYTNTIVAAFESPRYRENYDAAYYRRALPVAARYIYNTSKDDETGDAGTYASICLCGNGDVYKVISAFEKLGYDSVIHYGNNGNINTVIVFEANQIKLVGNKTYNNDSELMGENIESEVASSEVDLSSFKKRDTLPPGIWKDEETLNSRVRLKLLDIADDFWEFVNLTWVEPKSIIITGSICNFNWSKFSDIDLHLIVDFNEIDEKTEFVKQYLDSKKNEWNTEHEGLKIMGFPVELYVQDVNDKVEAGGIYDLEENAWIRRPNPHTIKSIGLNKFNIKDKAAEIMTIIDDMYDKLSTTTDGHEIEEIGDDAHYLWDKVKDMRKKSLSKNGESGSGNIVYKVLRRTGYLDRLFKLFSRVYDRSNSITESMKKYLTVLKEEVAIDGSSENNPYEKRWKAEREALKSFVANYGKLMQSREDNKGGKLYKVYYDETMSNLIGYNYCICVQWNEQEMKPGSTVYIRALDKFTPFIRRNLQFDTRGMDNMRGTYDDNRFVRESVDELNLYHSSYSNFDKFNHRKYLSSGAGSQTFGWGTYLTDSFPIAESYAGKFIWQKFNEFVVSAEPEDYIGNTSQYNDEIVKEACRLYRSIVRTRIVFTYGIERKYNRNFFDCNFEVTGDPAEEYDNVLKQYEKFKEEFKEVIEKQAEAGRPLSDEQLRKAFYVLKNGNEILDTPRDEYIATTTARNSVNSLVKLIINNIWDAADNHVKKESYIYEVEIPDDNGYNYLDYSNQVSPEIAKLISNGVMKLYRRFGNKIDTNRLDNAVEECLNGRMKGKYLYEELTSALGGSEKAASLFLNQCGIVGIKYKAGTIYGLPDGADESSLNYVIFDSNNVRITSKNLFTDNF